MKLTVLVPSAEYKSYAGARIRYGRIGSKLPEHGIELAVEDIGEFKPQSADCDAILISKCHDPRSLVAAAILSERGRLVGVDLFDDYFSQTGDSRLARYRTWLSQLLAMCDFALCSTEAMASVVERYRANVPTHVMNDPGPKADPEGLARAAAAKLTEARNCACIRVAWFGVGDNPHFPVGLDDLAAFGGVLRALGRGGLDVQLRVLTNARALTAERLARVGALPVRTSIEEWSEEGERALLDEALIAFLPVGAQGFSTAKSLNRAVTALSAGCQVLSVGYPLYSALDPLIYRDAKALLEDLESGSMRLSPQRMDVYREAMHSFASADSEAGRLAAFLADLTPSQTKGTITIVHGHATNGIAHKMVQAADGLSVASPYSTAPLGYDVIFRAAADRPTMLVSAKAARRLRPEFQSGLQAAGTIDGRKFLEVRDSASRSRGVMFAPSAETALSFQLATYGDVLHDISNRMNDAFGPCRIIVSETSPLPFSAAN